MTIWQAAQTHSAPICLEAVRKLREERHKKALQEARKRAGIVRLMRALGVIK